VSKAVLAFDRVSAHADERRSKFHLRPVGWLSGRFRFSRWCVALDWFDLHLIHKNMAVATFILCHARGNLYAGLSEERESGFQA
jgi:hypothetical protein